MVLLEVLERVRINKALLRAAEELLPSDITMEVFEIEGIPLFNQDTEKDMPAKVKEFKSKIREADALAYFYSGI